MLRLVLLVVLIPLLHIAAGDDDFRFAIIKFENEKILAIVGTFGKPLLHNQTTSSAIVQADPFDSCNATQPINGFAFVQRGNCTFVNKTLIAQQGGAEGVIMTDNVDENLGTLSFYRTGERDDEVTIPSLMISMDDGDLISQKLNDGPLLASIYHYEPSIIDASAIFIIIIAIFCLVVGAYWSSERERAIAYQPLRPSTTIPPQEEVAVLTAWFGVGFIIVASIALLLLFFFSKNMIYLIIAAFCIAGCTSITQTLIAIFRKFSLFKGLDYSYTYRYIGEVNVLTCILFLPSSAFSIFWAVQRNTEYAWFFQDTIAICLLLVIQRNARLANIKVATVLLVLAFFYDIFWVFISPYLFKKSVMVSVATGGGTGESMPMLIRIPKMSGEFSSYSLLGLGDIALPGLLSAYLLRFDYQQKYSVLRGYCFASCIGYFVGIMVTFVVLIIMKEGQPALLYLVPAMFIPVFSMAAYRKDLAKMWTGIHNDHQETSGVSSASDDMPHAVDTDLEKSEL